MSTGLTRGVDRALHVTTVGHTTLGPLVRRHWWPTVSTEGMRGSCVLVTGATSGVGQATAAGLAAAGAEVVMLGRSAQRLEATVARIRRATPGARFQRCVCDVSDLQDVRRCVGELAATTPRLHGIVHNAGTVTHERRETSGGHEVQLATHVLGAHLLTAELLPVLSETLASSVVFVSSGGMYFAPPACDDPESRSGTYSGFRTYALTKRMQVMLARVWARRLVAAGVRAHSMDPGWVDTPGLATHLPRFRSMLRPLLRSPAQGADTAIWLIAQRPPETGEFWHDRMVRPTTRRGGTPPASEDQERRLVEYVESATGTTGLLDG